MTNLPNSEIPLVQLRSVSKRFGATQALKDITVDFYAGKVHALVGENGAGKSTLGKILLGAHSPSDGTIEIDQQPVVIPSPAHGARYGLAGIAQELSLLPSQSVSDNIALGREVTRGLFVDSVATRKASVAVMQKYDMVLDPDALVETLSMPDQQRVEVLRALARQARLIVFDEPTARLATHQAEQLRVLIRSLAEAGAAIVYVSHFLEEILAISDTISVLRNGKHIFTRPAANETRASLISAMTGSELTQQFPSLPEVPADAKPILSVKNLSRKSEFESIDFDIRAGEIVSLAGLVGSGRSELAMSIYGASRADQGSVTLAGQTLIQHSVADSIEAGMALIPESRRDQGLMLRRSVLENTSLPHLARFKGWLGIATDKERQTTQQHCSAATVKASSLKTEVQFLSGGNQQKVLFARATMGEPTLLIADEPTRGVDVGAKRGIYDLIIELARQGQAILLISSEIEEIIGLSHRSLVMSRGKIVAELSGDQLNQDTVMRAAFSGV